MKKQYKALFFDLDRTLLDFSASEKGTPYNICRTSYSIHR